jgi:hypothetical protein
MTNTPPGSSAPTPRLSSTDVQILRIAARAERDRVGMFPGREEVLEANAKDFERIADGLDILLAEVSAPPMPLVFQDQLDAEIAGGTFIADQAMRFRDGPVEVRYEPFERSDGQVMTLWARGGLVACATVVRTDSNFSALVTWPAPAPAPRGEEAGSKPIAWRYRDKDEPHWRYSDVAEYVRYLENNPRNIIEPLTLRAALTPQEDRPL